jgi:hypothetical protein
MDPRSYPVSGNATPQLLVDDEPYTEEQPLTSLLKSLQNALNVATAIDTGRFLLSFLEAETVVLLMLLATLQSGDLLPTLGFESNRIPSHSINIPVLTLQGPLRRFLFI